MPSSPQSPSRPRRRDRLLTLVLAAVLALTGGLLLPSSAAAAPGANGVPVNAYELDLLTRTNDARAAAGIPLLTAQNGITDLARKWAGVLAQRGALSHNPDLANQLVTSGAPRWTSTAENVGQGGSSAAVFQAYMNSAGHRDNILRTSVTTIGIGSARSADGKIWDVMVFVDSYDSAYGAPRTSPPNITAAGVPSGTPAPAPAPAPERFIQARDTATGGAAPYAFAFGSPASTTLGCDVNGDGRDDVVAYQDGNWAVRTSLRSGAPDLTFSYGFPGAIPVCGDWDGNGRDGIGVYADGGWYLRQTASAGTTDAGRFDYGWRGTKPVVGDWDGDGRDGIGIFDTNGGNYWIRNSAGPGAADSIYQFGWGAATPVTGDWNGDGRTDTGIYDGGQWYLRDSATPGPTNRLFGYGGPGARPVVGNWDGITGDGIAVSWGR